MSARSSKTAESRRLLHGDGDEAAAQPLKVFTSIGAFPFTVTAATMQLVLMLTTYVTCVFVTKHCTSWFLPTISNTWEAPPGNYLSRWVVSFVCVCINVVVCGVNYFKTQSINMKYPGSVAAMAAVGVVCLSWVGSICDSKDPSCRGDNAIHTPLAITFFILFNVYMVLLSAATPHGRKWKYLGATCVSVLCTGFMATNHFAGLGLESIGGFPITAVVEWTDVFLILTWFTIYVGGECSAYRIGFISVEGGATQSKTEQMLAFFSASNLATIATGLCLATTLVTWVIALNTGTVKKGVFPTFGDMWWSAPGNWVARWGVVLGCTFLYLHEINLYFMNTASSTTQPPAATATATGTGTGAGAPARRRLQKKESALLMVLGIVGAFGLSVVGCISEKEDPTLHYGFAALWFVGYDVYMVLYSLRSVLRKSRKAAIASALCFGFSTLMKSRYLQVGGLYDKVGQNTTWADEYSGQGMFALYEWADMLIVLIFINLTISLHETTYETPTTKYGIGIYHVVSSSQSAIN